MAANDNLTTKQRKGIAALLTERTAKEAAQKAGISETQMHRWLEMPDFKAALREAEDSMIDNAARRLSIGLGTALDALAELTQGASSESVKRAAAAEWLTQAFRVQEIRILSERITELENKLKNLSTQ